jgi:two-component system NarL family sensor kinase
VATDLGTRSLERGERLAAWLRLAVVPLIVAAQSLPHPVPHRQAFAAAAAAYFVYGLVALAWTQYGRLTGRLASVSTAIDVVAISLLAFLSGGAYSEARLTYFLIPFTAAFRFRPRGTALTGAAVALAYLTVAAFHPASHGRTAWSFIAVQEGYLLWLATAATLFADMLASRNAAVLALADSRQQLLADSLSAEDRARRTLAESLHDNAIQNLLAARQDIEEAARTHEDENLTRARTELTKTVADLRNAIFELHPDVLEQAGLEAALRAVAERVSRRGGFDTVLNLNYRQRHHQEGLLFGAAREFLINAAKHSQAKTVALTLAAEGPDVVLAARDDGVGFDPRSIDDRVASGHIGLRAQRERLEAAGGSLSIVSAPGHGTTVAARIPRENGSS